MKHARIISGIMAGFGCAVLLARLAPPSIGDWIVRGAGALTLVALFVLAFTTARLHMREKGGAPSQNDPEKP